MKNKNKNFLDYSLALLVIVFSFLLWRSINQTNNISDVNSWLVPIIFFAITLILFELLEVISRQKLLIALAAGFLIFSGLFFIFDFWHLAILVLCYSFLTFSIFKIKNDVSLSIKINFYKSVRIGMVLFILAFSLAVSSHYFFQTENTNLEKNAPPKLNISWLIKKVTPKILGTINEDFQGIEKKNLTVDEWILETEKENLEKFSIGKKSFQEGLLLEKGRLQMEELFGSEIKGNEKISDVISQMVENKVSDFVVDDYSKDGFPAIPFAFSIILLLTLFSIGAFLYPSLTLIAKFIFWILKKTKLVKIAQELRDVETIQ